MQEKDKVTNLYLGNPERLADIVNAYLYQGKQLLSKDSIRERKQVYYMNDKNDQGESWGIVRDIVVEAEMAKEVEVQTELAAVLVLIAVENQTRVHYAMPLRIMKADVTNYDEQYKCIKNEHKKNHDLHKKEFISGIKKEDKLIPVITICVYWGEEPWDGPRCMKDMLNMEGMPEAVKALLADYPMNLIEINKFPHTEYLKKDLRIVVEFLKNRSDMQAMKKYVDEHRAELECVSEDAFDVMCEMSHGKGLAKYKAANKNERGEIQVCKAFDDWSKELHDDGIEEGMLLMCKMIQLNDQGKKEEEISDFLKIPVCTVNKLLTAVGK